MEAYNSFFGVKLEMISHFDMNFKVLFKIIV